MLSFGAYFSVRILAFIQVSEMCSRGTDVECVFPQSSHRKYSKPADGNTAIESHAVRSASETHSELSDKRSIIFPFKNFYRALSKKCCLHLNRY